MSPNKNLTIALIQSSCSEKPEENLKKSVGKVKEAAKKGAKIICLQELYRTAYFPQYEKKDFSHLAETIPGESTNTFSKLAKENNAVIIVPIFEKDKGKLYNSAVVIDADGKVLETYRKIHVPYDPLFYEKTYFEAGNNGYKVYNTKYGKFSVLICYDQWFPEAARICTLKGADIIFYPTAIGWFEELKKLEPSSQKRWENAMCAHASMNGVYAAAVNRVGKESKIEFWGNSFVADPFGNVIARASDAKEEIIISDLDLSLIEASQQGWGFLKNRRPETYKRLVE